MIQRPAVAAAFMILSAASAASAAPPLRAAASTVTASNAWSRPAAAGLATGVVYLNLHNGGPSLDRLIGADSRVAARISLHQSMDMGGMMSMAPIADGLALPSGATVKLAPGGYHLMLEGLKGALTPGARYPLTLHFAHAPPLRTMVAVRAAAP